MLPEAVYMAGKDGPQGSSASISIHSSSCSVWSWESLLPDSAPPEEQLWSTSTCSLGVNIYLEGSPLLTTSPFILHPTPLEEGAGSLLCAGGLRGHPGLFRGWYVCRDRGWRAGASGPGKSTCPLSCSRLHWNATQRDMAPQRAPPECASEGRGRWGRGWWHSRFSPQIWRAALLYTHLKIFEDQPLNR